MMLVTKPPECILKTTSGSLTCYSLFFIQVYLQPLVFITEKSSPRRPMPFQSGIFRFPSIHLSCLVRPLENRWRRDLGIRDYPRFHPKCPVATWAQEKVKIQHENPSYAMVLLAWSLTLARHILNWHLHLFRNSTTIKNTVFCLLPVMLEPNLWAFVTKCFMPAQE